MVGKNVFLDKYGYRVPNNKFIYEDRPRKIIFIGDSVLFGSGVDEQKTFAGKLREVNNDTLVINAAIIGNDITEILNDIKKNYELFNASDFFIVLTLDDIMGNNEINNVVEKNKTKV